MIAKSILMTLKMKNRPTVSEELTTKQMTFSKMMLDLDLMKQPGRRKAASKTWSASTRSSWAKQETATSTHLNSPNHSWINNTKSKKLTVKTPNFTKP